MKNMFILSNDGQPLKTLRGFFRQSNKEILIIAPYIRVSTLKELQLPINRKITIITTLRMQDLWFGSSDIMLYPYAHNNSISLFINNSIHLKAYVRDWGSCIFGSSNLSGRGMGTGSGYNYELNSLVTKLDVETIIYFNKILSESVLMNDKIYKCAVEKVDRLNKTIKFEDINIENMQGDKEYLISSLPMSTNVERFYHVVSHYYKSDDQEEIECAIHDGILYGMPSNLSHDEFMQRLSLKFFSSGFIIDLLNYIDSKERYFGEVKEWIQAHCEDVPTPSRRDLTGNIQVLYKWIVELSDGEYRVDRPNYSERIYRCK